MVQTRNKNQIRSHAQKFFKKLRLIAQQMQHYEKSDSNDQKSKINEISEEWIRIIKDPRFASEIWGTEAKEKPNKEPPEQNINPAFTRVDAKIQADNLKECVPQRARELVKGLTDTNRLRMGRPHSDLDSELPPAKKFKSDQEPNVLIGLGAVLEERKEDRQQPVLRADAANLSHGSLRDKEEISSSLHESSRRAANRSGKRRSNERQLGFLKEAIKEEVENITKNKLLLLKTYADYIKESLKNACNVTDMSELIYKMTKISKECGIVTKLVKDLIPHMEASTFPAK